MNLPAMGPNGPKPAKASGIRMSPMMSDFIVSVERMKRLEWALRS